MENATVLVVDDEVEMLTLLRNYLTREGYAVTTASERGNGAATARRPRF